jgi:hypothetical protein
VSAARGGSPIYDFSTCSSLIHTCQNCRRPIAGTHFNMMTWIYCNHVTDQPSQLTRDNITYITQNILHIININNLLTS